MVAARATRYTFAWMFEMFTEQSRQAVVLAQEEARALNHGYIGTEHVLLGLLRQEEGLAVRALRSLDITADRVRAQVVRIVGQGEDVPGRQVPFTPHTKRVLELALREALAFGHNYVGTEHILIGLVREHGGMAARILLDFDADAEKVRNRIAGMLSGRGERGPGARADSGDLPDVKRLRMTSSTRRPTGRSTSSSARSGASSPDAARCTTGSTSCAPSATDAGATRADAAPAVAVG